MPKRLDINKILIIGAGPIVIGQACEFDYSGTQACKALKEEGYEIILINSNPATIMTDPELADRTYVEPITPEVVAEIIKKEKPDAILPTMGGQTALNTAMSLAENGTLDKYNVELIGAKIPAIKLAEDRALFKDLMTSIGLESPRSETANNYLEGQKIAQEIGFPIILRPAFTLGGSGGGVCHTPEEFDPMLKRALAESPTSQVLIEENLTGWKEYELEVVRDLHDNVAIICSIENFDPMGVHTGDSITVAPSQTLSDVEYQNLRNQSISIIRAVGVESGGSNIQFGINPKDGRVVVIEMNPRVSRSSALASKATGYPIAKVAAKLAIGYTLDELPNEITKTTSSAFEPSIDYVVTKIPRFAFDKFPGSEDILTTQMKSVGEVMSVGRTFCESFQKALRGLETGMPGFGPFESSELSKEELLNKLSKPSSQRIKQLWQSFDKGATIEEVFNSTKIDLWFLTHLNSIFTTGKKLESLANNPTATAPSPEKKQVLLQEIKSQGFSNKQLASYWGKTEIEIQKLLETCNIAPVYKMIDTCAGEIESNTPYYYSTYEQENEILESDKKKVMILGGGPNRIGQGIEFDYCCVHASMVLREFGYETIMVNSNPETVSTDFDISDRLYFEPITAEDVINIYKQEKPLGVIAQLGGQTPLNVAQDLVNNNVNILGTSVQTINDTEDRDIFNKLIERLELKQSKSDIANSFEEVTSKAEAVGYPVLVRPSFVIGGQAMQTVYNTEDLQVWLNKVSNMGIGFPILIDKFLDNAIELDVDSVSDGSEVIVTGILEHIERAGIHSGDSSCTLPTQSLTPEQIDNIIETTTKLTLELKVKGLINVQYALKDNELYIIEVNPRASRTVPFVAKATGIPWAKIGTLLMLDHNLQELKDCGKFPGLDTFSIKEFAKRGIIAVKEAVLPFKKFAGCEITLGPEMRSTGEVMGISDNFGLSFAKSQLSATQKFNLKNKSILLTVSDDEKPNVINIARELVELGFTVYTTVGTHHYLEEQGISTIVIRKAGEMSPNIIDYLIEHRIAYLINLPRGKQALQDSMAIRRVATLMDLPLVTTLAGAVATVEAIKALEANTAIPVKALQDY